MIDQITEVHMQSEKAKLNSQKRHFEQMLKQKLDEQARIFEKEKVLF